MTDRSLTLMAVHAHPDDEATSTGGVLARYAAEGVTTVLVTCTDGVRRRSRRDRRATPGTTRRPWSRCAAPSWPRAVRR
ncbi:PIG-L family deacetylase [Micromonospora sp. BRA006-A]|nr:PIG-L family deacetylase [Micromonospora sp. BRA006-A]